MFNKVRFACCIVLTGATFFLTGAVLNLQYGRIELTTGEVLENVTLKSYNIETRQVSLQLGKSLSSKHISLFPSDIRERILVLSEGDEVKRKRNLERRQLAEKKRAGENNAADSKKAGDQSSTREKRDESELQYRIHKRLLERIEYEVERRINRYYREEHGLGINKTIIRLKVDLDWPQQDPFNEFRYVTKGKVTVKYRSSFKYNRIYDTWQLFEVTSLVDKNGNITCGDVEMRFSR